MVRSPFLDFIRLVVDDEVDNVSRRLRTNPALATTAASAGATRQEAASCFFKQISSLAQFERRLIQERTKAGLAAARARGRTGGRPPLTPKDAKVALANKLFADKSVDPDDICATLKISKTTLYRYVEIATGRVIRSRNHPR